MIDIFGIIFLIIELFFIIFFIIKSIKNNEILNNKTIWYVIPLFILNIFIYIVGNVYTLEGKFKFYNFSETLNAAIKSFGFEMKYTLVLKAMNDSIIFKSAYYIASFLSGITLLSAFIGFFKVTIRNKLRVVMKTKKGKDIVVGYNDFSFKYAANNDGILWIDRNRYNLSYHDKVSLFTKKIAYIYAPLSDNKLSRFIKTNKNKLHFICFMNDDKDNLLFYIETFQKVTEKLNKEKAIYLNIEVKNEQLDFINNQITKSISVTDNNLIVNCFSISELLSRKFIMENNFLDYIPSGFIDKGVLKKDINVFYLGFGATNQAIFKANTLNNHFVQVEDNHFSAKPVNNYLFDLNKEKFNSELVTRLMMNYDSKDSYKYPMEKICNVTYKDLNIKSIDFINYLDQVITNDSYNIFFINFSNFGENVSFAELLDNYLENKHHHLYYKVNSKKEIICDGFSNNVSAYGFGNELLTHDIIANDSLSYMARIINNRYAEIKNQDIIKWQKLPIIEKYSNIYNSINIRFKLELIEPKFIDLNYFSKNIDSLNDLLFEGKSKEEVEKLKSCSNYDDYFDINLRNAIGYMEHLRWNAFYYIHGFNTMNLEDIKFVDNKALTKDVNFKKHACLTSAKGLDVLHHKLVDIYKENGLNKTLNDVEVYKYDLMNVDTLYDNIINLRKFKNK